MKCLHQCYFESVRVRNLAVVFFVWGMWAGVTSAQQFGARVTSSPVELEERVRTLQQQASFEQAIGELGALLEADELDLELRRTAYLLTIETHILYGTTFYDAGRTETAELYWDRARALTRELLGHAEYRKTRAPVETSPTLMLTIFDDVRAELFGSLRLESVEPPDAEIRLDGERLTLDPDYGILELPDVPIGAHTLLVRADDYEDSMTEIEIEPGQIYSTSVSLEKAKTWQWWTWRVGGATAVGAAIYLLGSSGDEGGTPEPDPLPGPPAPPGS